jgi:hypothetical protein
MWDNPSCRGRQESESRRCDDCKREAAHLEMDRRAKRAMNAYFESCPEELLHEIWKIVERNRPPHIPKKWWVAGLPRAERVRLGRLGFELRRQSTLPSERIVENWLYYDEIRRCTQYPDSFSLGRTVTPFEKQIADAKVEGIEIGDPYLVELCRMSRKYRRKLKRAQFVEALKARAALHESTHT